jgi:hypothetical protein
MWGYGKDMERVRKKAQETSLVFFYSIYFFFNTTNNVISLPMVHLTTHLPPGNHHRPLFANADQHHHLPTSHGP